jgi:hypothetical protein
MHHFKFFPALIALFALAFAGCDKHNHGGDTHNTELNITFRATYDGVPLEFYKKYDYDTYQVQFSRFNTYLSDIKLLKDNAEISVSEVAWVDFTPTGSSNGAVEVVLKATVPGDDYTGIKMGYGVNPALNAKKPSDFAAGHPLSFEGEFWPGWKSYIFNKIEGNGDSDADGIDDVFMVFHCGSDKVYREVSFSKAISAHLATTNLVVEIDLKKLFNPDGTWWDMKLKDNQKTSELSSDVRVATYLMDNFDNATTLK